MSFFRLQLEQLIECFRFMAGDWLVKFFYLAAFGLMYYHSEIVGDQVMTAIYFGILMGILVGRISAAGEDDYMRIPGKPFGEQ